MSEYWDEEQRRAEAYLDSEQEKAERRQAVNRRFLAPPGPAEAVFDRWKARMK